MKRATLSLCCALMCGVCVTLGAQQLPVEVATLPTPTPAMSFVLARTGRVAAAFCDDGKLRVWSLPDGSVVQTIELGDRRLDVVVISADGRSIAAGDHAGAYTVWDSSTGARKFELKMPFYPTALAFSPDGARLAIAPVGEPVQIYELAARRMLVELQRPVGGSAALAFSPDGGRIAAADADTVVRVYDARTGKLLATNTDFLLEPLAAVFTADGNQLVTGGGDKITATLDAATGKVIRQSSKLDDPVAALDVSPDGRLIATVLMHADNMLMPGPVIVSEAASGRSVMKWLPATLALGGGWTTDGRLLIATSGDKAVHVWRVH